MPRDYAKYRTVKRRQKKNWRRAGSLFAAIFTLCLAAGGYGFYRYQKHESVVVANEMGTMWSAFAAKFHHKKPQPLLAQTKDKPSQPAEEDVHFNFYTELPNMQVTPAAMDENSAPKPVIKEVINDDNPVDQEAVSNDTKTLQYVLRMGVFTDVNTASQSRLSLLLGGFESEVVKTTENGQSVYVVQQGPFANAAQAKAAQKKLMNKGVESTVKKTYL